MELNADFSRRAVVHAARLAWAASPLPGVERRMLDRIGDEVARATTIVRYAPGSSFSAHIMTAVRNLSFWKAYLQTNTVTFRPEATCATRQHRSTHHGSVPGCVIFVKLHQFAPDDRTQVRIDTRQRPFRPAPGRPGVELQPLFRDDREDVRLERWAPDARVEHRAEGGIELLVLDGRFCEGGEEFAPQSWLRLPPGSILRAEAGPEGCRLWVKSALR